MSRLAPALSAPLRVVFILTALLFLPAGGLLYFLPPAALGVSPLWLGRVAGALLLGWGVSLLAGAGRPDGRAVSGLVAGNLLICATLVPAALRAGLPPALNTLFLALAAALLMLAVLALLLPRGRRA
ncbi:MAG: hypothetical protein ACR2J4_00495 [Deinococcus sp.]